MHIPRIFPLVTKGPFSFQTRSNLQSIPSTSSSQHNSHHSITYSSYFQHIHIQFLPHHNSHINNSISLSRPPQLISPFFHPTHPITCLFHHTSCKQHTSIILYVSPSPTSPPFPLTPPMSHIPTRTTRHQSGLQSYCELCSHAPG